MTGRATIDFYYGLGSRYSYLAATQIAALEAETGCRVAWHPIDSRALIPRGGGDPFDGSVISGQYDWAYRRNDAESWAAFYGVPYNEPNFDDYVPADLARAAGAAQRLGAVVPYSHALFRKVFVDGGVIDEAVYARLAEDVGIDRDAFAATLADATLDAELAATVDAVQARGAFGVPTFLAGERLFRGNDRLVLLRHHLRESDA